MPLNLPYLITLRQWLRTYYHSPNLKEVFRNGFPLPPVYQTGKESFLEELRSMKDILGEFFFFWCMVHNLMNIVNLNNLLSTSCLVGMFPHVSTRFTCTILLNFHGNLMLGVHFTSSLCRWGAGRTGEDACQWVTAILF